MNLVILKPAPKCWPGSSTTKAERIMTSFAQLQDYIEGEQTQKQFTTEHELRTREPEISRTAGASICIQNNCARSSTQWVQGSGVATAVVGIAAGSDSIRGLGPSICHRCTLFKKIIYPKHRVDIILHHYIFHVFSLKPRLRQGCPH